MIIFDIFTNLCYHLTSLTIWPGLSRFQEALSSSPPSEILSPQSGVWSPRATLQLRPSRGPEESAQDPEPSASWSPVLGFSRERHLSVRLLHRSLSASLTFAHLRLPQTGGGARVVLARSGSRSEESSVMKEVPWPPTNRSSEVN